MENKKNLIGNLLLVIAAISYIATMGGMFGYHLYEINILRYTGVIGLVAMFVCLIILSKFKNKIIINKFILKICAFVFVLITVLSIIVATLIFIFNIIDLFVRWDLG